MYAVFLEDLLVKSEKYYQLARDPAFLDKTPDTPPGNHPKDKSIYTAFHMLLWLLFSIQIYKDIFCRIPLR